MIVMADTGGERANHAKTLRHRSGRHANPLSLALCWSEGRTQKDRAIRQKHEVRFLADTEKLAKRIALGRLRTSAKIYEAIGRLKERYPRVARYYELAYDQQQSELSCSEDLERKQKA